MSWIKKRHTAVLNFLCVCGFVSGCVSVCVSVCDCVAHLHIYMFIHNVRLVSKRWSCDPWPAARGPSVCIKHCVYSGDDRQTEEQLILHSLWTYSTHKGFQQMDGRRRRRTLEYITAHVCDLLLLLPLILLLLLLTDIQKHREEEEGAKEEEEQRSCHAPTSTELTLTIM